MKIGILTFHRPSNFGANLQAFSSYRYLTSWGYVTILETYTEEIVKEEFPYVEQE